MKELEWIHIAETDSTNDYLKRLNKEKELSAPIVVYTDYQTKGKGQAGNRWDAERGKNLLFSLYLKPNNLHLNDYFVITEIITIAIQKTLSYFTEDITIKWPNDIYWQDKKIGGVLIENSICQSQITSTIIGVGLNINQKNFHPNLPNPISLYHIIHKEQNLIKLLNAICEATISFFKNIDRDKIHNQYVEKLFRIDEKHYYIDVNSKERLKAMLITVNHQGQLILRTERDEIKKYYFKEVEYLI